MESEDRIKKQRIVLICSAIVLIVILVAVIVVLSINWNPSGSFFIRIVPNNAEIVIGGESFDNNSSYALPIGNYSGIVKSDGFNEKNIEFSIVENETTTVFEYLSPSNHDYSVYESDYDEMYALIDYANIHPDDSELVEFTNSFLDMIDSMKKILPIEYVPLEDPYDGYKIMDGSSDSDCPVFCVYIEASTEYMLEKALAILQHESKYPLNKYVILKKVRYQSL